jgi:KaiC/GvpD/RAD55 family RecA-like ATPase
MAAVHGMGDLPEKSVILIEEETGAVKSMYALFLASESAAAGHKVRYITSRPPHEINHEMEYLRLPQNAMESVMIEEVPQTLLKETLESVTSRSGFSLVIVDQFSLSFLAASLEEVRESMSCLSKTAQSGVIFLLLIDRGLLNGRHERLMEAMADGVIQITTVPEGDKLKRFLNIPKLKGMGLLDKMLPFTVTGEGFLIDTRERHG